MARYNIEDLNTHCSYDFGNYGEATRKYNELLKQSPDPKLIMKCFTPNYKSGEIIIRILETTN